MERTVLRALVAFQHGPHQRAPGQQSGVVVPAEQALLRGAAPCPPAAGWNPPRAPREARRDAQAGTVSMNVMASDLKSLDSLSHKRS